jgi:hypothetical protein
MFKVGDRFFHDIESGVECTIISITGMEILFKCNDRHHSVHCVPNAQFKEYWTPINIEEDEFDKEIKLTRKIAWESWVE